MSLRKPPALCTMVMRFCNHKANVQCYLQIFKRICFLHLLRRDLIQVGDWNVSSPVDCVDGLCSPGVIQIRIQKAFVNYYPTYPFVNDIGLLKLEMEVQFTGIDCNSLILTVHPYGKNLFFSNTQNGFHRFACPTITITSKSKAMLAHRLSLPDGVIYQQVFFSEFLIMHGISSFSNTFRSQR